MNYQWQLSQQKNELAETDISQSVTRKIKKFWRLIKERDECKEALKISKSNLPKAEEGSKEYNKIERAIASLETTIPQLEEEIKEFDAVLTKDMDRLKRDQPINQARVARLNQAGKGIKKNSDEDGTGTKASMPVMITNEMRTALYALGYSVTDVDALRPAEAAKLLADGTAKPAVPQPTPGPESAPAAPPPAPPKAPTAEQPKPAKPTANPTKTEGDKKKNNGLIIGIGSVIAFLGGVFLGRKIGK